MAHWRTAMRQDGFDPDAVVDAPERLGHIEATVTLQDMKGAVIGDLENCSGARCLRRKLASVLPGADMNNMGVFVGASRAFVIWRQKNGTQKGFRFLVNGLPDAQDRTMNVVGEKLILRPPNGRTRTGRGTQGGKHKKPRTRGVTTGGSSRTRGLAAQLRAM